MLGTPSRGPIGNRSLPDKRPAQPNLVATRRVIHISGFEPIPHRAARPPDEQRAAPLCLALGRDGNLFALRSRTGPALRRPGMSRPRARTGRPACRYTVLRWDELMAPYVGRSWLGRMLHGYKALFEFIWTGTLRRYFKANIRYGLFFIYPLLTLFGLRSARHRRRLRRRMARRSLRRTRRARRSGSSPSPC